MLMLRFTVFGVAILVASSIGAGSNSPALAAAPGNYPWPLPNHFFVPPIAFSSDGRYLALGGSVGPAIDNCGQPLCEGRLHIWDLQTGQRVFANESTFARVMSIVFSRDGHLMITGHSDGSVLAWNARDFKVMRRFSCCSGTWIRALALSPDEKTLAIGGQNGQLVLWNIADDLGAQAAGRGGSRSWAAHYYGISSLTFDATGEHLLSSADDQHIRRWNLETGGSYQFRRSPGRDKAHRGMVKTIVTLNNGKQALSGAYWEGGTVKDYRGVAPPDHILRLWDVNSGTALKSYPLTYGIRCCIQVLNDHLVAFLKATGWDERLIFQIFNLDSATVEHEFSSTMGESFHTMAMHPGARLFLIGIGEGRYLVWDIRTGKSIAHVISVDEGWAVFASDGRADFSDGFRRWPCRHDIQQACLGGKDVSPTRRLLAHVFEAR